ncbi:hypothetical protein [Amycolatopsis sp. NPDC059021]|uniref:hypothetical protein n=1 Tax=Amycolatopsis sp. NPDC059021 TaxID=3346704 RepID=UPI00366F52A5
MTVKGFEAFAHLVCAAVAPVSGYGDTCVCPLGVIPCGTVQIGDVVATQAFGEAVVVRIGDLIEEYDGVRLCFDWNGFVVQGMPLREDLWLPGHLTLLTWRPASTNRSHPKEVKSEGA